MGRGSSRKEISIPLSELLPIEDHYRSKATLSNRMSNVFLTLLGTSWFLLLLWSGSTIGVLGLLFYIGLFISRKVKQTRAVKKNQLAVDLLNDMRYEDASFIFEELTLSEQNSTSHPVYIFNRGVSFLLSGRHMRAFSLFNSVLRGRIFSFSDAYEPILLADMATCLVLDGQVEEAAEFLNKASFAARSQDRGYVVFVQALYYLRSGQMEKAFFYIVENWDLGEQKLRLPFRCAMSLLLAFSARMSGHEEYVNSSLDQIAFSKPSLLEFHWLIKKWPEMASFMERELSKREG